MHRGVDAKFQQLPELVDLRAAVSRARSAQEQIFGRVPVYVIPYAQGGFAVVEQKPPREVMYFVVPADEGDAIQMNYLPDFTR